MHEQLSLSQASEHLRISEEDLRKLAKFDEVPHTKRADGFFFDSTELDAWASRRILGMRVKDLKAEHTASTRKDVKVFADDILLPELLKPEHIEVDFRAKTRRSVINDLVSFAATTDLLYDPIDLLRQLEEREAISSTAMPGGIALLHPHHQDPYLIAEPFMMVGITRKPIFFGAEDDSATDIFCLICCGEHLRHLHVLGRLCMMIRDTNLLQSIREASDAETICQTFFDCEKEVLKAMR